MALETNTAGFSTAGWTDIVTSDAVVHGQVRQSANFAFARVYYSGHEVPFYQPLLSLELFERVINGTDVATGLSAVAFGANYTTVGSAESTFREGNATVQFEVLGADATYNTTTGAPNPTGSSNGTAAAVVQEARSLKRTASRAQKRLAGRASSDLRQSRRRWA